MIRNALTVDVEECFHTTEAQMHLRRQDWCKLPSRLDFQVSQTLDLLDAHGVSATFFVLGWAAEHHPAVIRKIAARGHEVGCHSYAHPLITSLTPAQFRKDTRRAVAAIEDACGVVPRCYRAPSYSITQASIWALEILVENGFTHDSSIYPIRHDRYGIVGFSRHAAVLSTPAGPICEVPVATAQLGQQVTPVGGGGYLRMLPYSYVAAGVRRVNEVEEKPVCMYFHPWELDAAQPRLSIGRLSRLRTYTGLSGMLSKIQRLLRDFQFSPLTDVYPGPEVEFSSSCVRVGWRLTPALSRAAAVGETTLGRS
jgi:polysaccharide deacetylase family protein (PEP-CTERM system associated)